MSSSGIDVDGTVTRAATRSVKKATVQKVHVALVNVVTKDIAKLGRSIRTSENVGAKAKRVEVTCYKTEKINLSSRSNTYKFPFPACEWK